MKTIHRLFSLVLGILLALTLFVNQAKAQCDSCSHDIAPYSTAWNICAACPVEIILPSGCTMYVCYCWRRIPGWPIPTETTVQATITSIDSVGGCASDYTTQDLLDYVSDGVNNDVIAHLNPNQVPPCSGSYAYQHLELRMPSCMKIDSGSGNHKHFVGCHNTDSSYCVMKCELCLTGVGINAHIDRVNCVHNLYGTPDCPGGTAPTNMRDWTIGTCFQIPCGTGE